MTQRSPKLDRRARSANRSDTRSALVRCGVEMFAERGFQATGIDEVLKRVGVPKGSFYHFFPSKQAFGEAVIDSYAQYFERKLDRLLTDDSRPPLERLAAFVEEARLGMTKHQFQRGCLIGNLGQELWELNGRFRQKLEGVLLSWQHRTAACLREAAAAGELATRLNEADSEMLARFFWIGWEGAILRAKLTQNDEPLRLFADCFFKKFLR
ncbi:TetR family transcriptional regulator C-terminal domain-containing protein [Methylibium sp.]|uniref:acrylate utilization transcriptional regulator AcuR n=1 Tax=Methylibium sp. TaxID=2067992 RepID=UPI003BABB86B